MKSPRGAFVNLDDYQKRRFEFLRGAKELTQEMIKIVTSTLTNAVTAGQRVACIQTLELSTQYSYSRAEPHSRLSFVLHDMYSFQPILSGPRINLSARPLELAQWVQGKGYRVVCATQKDGGAFAPFVNLYAIATPEVATNELINYPFAPTPLESEWMTRVISAVRVGAMHTTICLMHVERDYSSVISTNFPCHEHPRDALTMQPVPESATFYLHEKWASLIAWVTQMPRAWTLAIVDEKYAYFVVLLQPIK